MPAHEWQLQEAKNKFSQVLQHAIQEGPQIITLHGKQAAVLLSIKEYKGYKEYLKLSHRPTPLSEFFQHSPLANLELDLTRNQDTGREMGDQEIKHNE